MTKDYYQTQFVIEIASDCRRRFANVSENLYTIVVRGLILVSVEICCCDLCSLI